MVHTTRDARETSRGRSTRRLAIAAAAVAAACLATYFALRGGADAGRLAAEAAEADRAGEPGRAAASLDALKRLRPLSGEERFLAAQSARLLRRFDEALAALDQFPGFDPLATSVPRAIGLIEFDARRFARAEANLRRALDIEPADEAARRGLIRLLGLQLRKKEVAAQFGALASLTKSKLSFDDLSWWASGSDPTLSPHDAAATLAEASRVDPADIRTRVALAETLRRLGRLDEADAALPREYRESGDDEARKVRARIEMERDDPAGASPPVSADDPALAEVLGRAALGRGDLAEAERLFKIALDVDPFDRDAQFGLGQVLRLSGRQVEAGHYLHAAEARDRLDRAIGNARTPENRANPQVLRAVASLCEGLDRRPEALAWYRLALARDPADPATQAAIYRLSQPGQPLNKPKT